MIIPCMSMPMKLLLRFFVTVDVVADVFWIEVVRLNQEIRALYLFIRLQTVNLIGLLLNWQGNVNWATGSYCNFFGLLINLANLDGLLIPLRIVSLVTC